MVGGKSLQPSHILLSFPTGVQAACLSSEHSVPQRIVRTSGSARYRWGQSRCLETRPLANKTEKKKTFRVKVQSPSSWLEETRSCKQTFPVLSVLCSRWSCPSYHSCTHTPSPAQLSCSLGLFSSKGLVGALMWSGGPWKPLRAEKDVFRGNREKH